MKCKINTDAPKETAGAPSLVLRCLGKQETAWDLAKRYNTTIGVILAVPAEDPSIKRKEDRSYS